MPTKVCSYITIAACLVLSSFIAVSQGVSRIGWDDVTYMHRAVCIDNAIFNPMLISFDTCLSGVVKDPIMAWLAWPWGPQAATESGIGLSYISLAILELGVCVAIVSLMLRVSIPEPIIITSFICLVADPLFSTHPGSFESDILVSLLVVLLGLLIPLELQPDDSGRMGSIRRGLLWGGVVAVGVMAKSNYIFFAALIGPALVYLRYRNLGVKSATISLIAAFVIASPVIVYHLLYWDQIVGHVLITLGPVAKYTSYGLTPISYVYALYDKISPMSAPVGILFVMILGWTLYRRPNDIIILLWPLLVSIIYFGVTACSENHDFRYAMPFLAALPFCLAGLTAGAESRLEVDRCAVLAIAIVVIVLAAPISSRPDLTYVTYAGKQLAALPNDRPQTVLIASDDSAINAETFLLAQQLNLKQFHQLSIDTIVYDEALGIPMADIMRRLESADTVIFLKGKVRKYPYWTNAHADEFRSHLIAAGFLRFDGAAPFLDVYRR